MNYCVQEDGISYNVLAAESFIRCCVPLFFICSGYFMFRKQKSIREIYGKLTRHILLPTLFVLLILFLFSGIFVNLMELFEVSRLLAALFQLSLHLFEGDPLVDHEHHEMVHQIGKLEHRFVIVAVLGGDDHLAALFAALFQDLVQPFLKEIARVRALLVFGLARQNRFIQMLQCVVHLYDHAFPLRSKAPKGMKPKYL